jgi:NADH:ubiquinone oxidoreductase subunit 2 (subunit N)
MRLSYLKYTSIHLFRMLQLYSNFSFEHGAAVILINIISYVVTLIALFCVLFLFNFKALNSLSDFKKLNIFTFAQLVFILCVLGLAGMPPFVGFITKFLAILILINKSSYLSLFLFFTINAFSVYFYIIILRFSTYQQLVNSSLNTTYFYRATSQSVSGLLYLMCFTTLNFFLYHELYNFLLMLFFIA